MALPWPLIAAGLAAGLAGGLHCAAMCGGIVTALSCGRSNAAGWPLTLASHAGRIGSYMAAGTLAGTAGSAALLLRGLMPVQSGLYLLANLAMVALGLYLLGLPRALAFIERPGRRIWAHVHPLMRPLLPANTLPRALGLGALWGWMPCGLVYSALALALLAGDGVSGALVMLAFGLGTLPHLLTAGWMLRRLSGQQQKWMRRGMAIVVLGMATLGLWRLLVPGAMAINPFFCFAPA